MHTQQATAARIGARIRARIADPKWDWRYPSTPAADPVDAAAIGRLRQEAARASRYLMAASTAVGLSLPLGNGTNGPWHRQAVLDARYHLGILDIASGWIAWLDLVVPTYVRRFAVVTDAGISPHGAGGNGAMGQRAVTQIALIHGTWATPKISPLPRPNVTEIEYGLQTCYGTIGPAPSLDTYLSEWASLILAGTPCTETTAPQWEQWRPQGRSMVLELAQKFLAALPYRCYWDIEIREGGRHHAGCRGEAEFRIYGSTVQRGETMRLMAACHAAFAAVHLRHADIQTRIALGLDVDQRDRDAVRGSNTGEIKARLREAFDVSMAAATSDCHN